MQHQVVSSSGKRQAQRQRDVCIQSVQGADVCRRNDIGPGSDRGRKVRPKAVDGDLVTEVGRNCDIRCGKWERPGNGLNFRVQYSPVLANGSVTATRVPPAGSKSSRKPALPIVRERAVRPPAPPAVHLCLRECPGMWSAVSVPQPSIPEYRPGPPAGA